MTHFQDIDSTLISLGEPERKKTGPFHYTAVPIHYGGKPLVIRVPGRLKVFEHGKGVSFSIGLSVDDTNRKAFEDIEDKIRTETRTILSHPAVPGFKKQEFQLIKVNEFGEFPKVYSKLYAMKDGRITARFYERVIRDSKTKKRLIPEPKGLVGTPFDGEIILQIQRLHLGSVRSITVVVKEVLVKEVVQTKSFFDDLPDDDLDDFTYPNVCIDDALLGPTPAARAKPSRASTVQGFDTVS